MKRLIHVKTMGMCYYSLSAYLHFPLTNGIFSLSLSLSPFSWPLAVLGKLIPVPETPISKIFPSCHRRRRPPQSKKRHYLCSFSLGCILTAITSNLFNFLFLVLQVSLYLIEDCRTYYTNSLSPGILSPHSGFLKCGRLFLFILLYNRFCECSSKCLNMTFSN